MLKDDKSSPLESTPEEYQPYIPESELTSEFTVTSIIMGSVLGIVFGAANAYLGLKVGMTVSASIPVAVISMGILRGMLRRGTVLENNMVQTIGSAGESLAAGVIFTIPALIIWGLKPEITKIFLISLIGGWLGVAFMIPLRRFLIVKEHKSLPYPEGTACAKVLIAGDTGGVKAKRVFTGLGVGAVYKFLMGGLGLWKEHPQWNLFRGANMKIGVDAMPALLGVGFIIGPRIAAYLFAGGALGWLVFIPAITVIGRGLTEPLFPATVPISALDAHGIWTNYIRYVGAGAVSLGGVASLIKAAPTIGRSFKLGFREIIHGLSGANEVRRRTQRDLPMLVVLIGAAAAAVILAFIPQVPVKLIGAILVVIFSFFFVTVSSRIVGLIGSSSNPASGMTIATLLATSLILVAFGWRGQAGMVAALSVGAIVCVAVAIAGDTSQDLKTGFLVGATPMKQQIGEFLGVATSALVVGWTVLILHKGYGIGSAELPAPQATLMSMVVKGVMTGAIPWTFVFIGMATALFVELVGVSSLPFAVGLYLPIELSTPVIIGGLVRGFVEKRSRGEMLAEGREAGVLYGSGLIAGDALVGILLSILVWQGIRTQFATGWMGPLSDWGTLAIFGLLTMSLWWISVGRRLIRDKNS
ncbi:MAG TPA: oligopeptide transporter, OPT family [Candidatus Latescibacteria bacterium]|nr:oligopeptide transporter, OPT family [Candidatus Latescibacterota bacterium]